MKVNIEIDCTPQEARTFFGLPDVEPMQKAMMERMQAQMEDAMQAMNPEALMKAWFQPNMEGFGAMQKAFFDAASKMTKGD